MSLQAFADGVVALHQGAQRIGGIFGIEIPVTEKHIRKYSKQILLYKCLGLGLLFMWAFVLDSTLGCLLTLGTMTQGVALGLLVRKVLSERSVAGVSRKMLMLNIVATVFRSQSTLVFHGYLPYFGVGEILFPLFDLSVAAMAVYLVVLTYRYSHTYSGDSDSMWVFWVVPLALCVGYLTHANANGNSYTDWMWMSAVWVEAFSMLPQIWMSRAGCNFTGVTSHFVALVFAARLMSTIYWYESYTQLALHQYEWGVGLLSWFYPGYSVLAAHALQMVSMGDFMYFYLTNAASRGSVLAMNGKLDL